MGEKILSYDRVISPQDYFWSCGAGSTQMVFSARNMYFTEDNLIAAIGTTVNGTDHVSQCTRVLNDRLGGGYVVRDMPNDPPTSAQVELLWSDVTASVGGGFGCVANIIAPPSNYPRGTRGSRSPAYSGGTVYHYVALLGYADDGPGGRHIWIGDSGFTPFGYWCSLEQTASLIAGKGYTAAPSKGGFLSALSDSEQREVLDGMRQLGRF